MKLVVIPENGSEIVPAFCIASPREAKFVAQANRANSIAQRTVSSALSLGVLHMRNRARHQVEADPRIQTKFHDRDLVVARGDTSNATSTTRTPLVLQCAKRCICSASGRALRSTRAASAPKQWQNIARACKQLQCSPQLRCGPLCCHAHCFAR